MSAGIELHTSHHEPHNNLLKRKKVPHSSSASKRNKQGIVKTEMVDIEETSEEIAKQYKKFTSAPKYDLDSEELFCICRKPDEGELMIACDGCEEWFHAKCMNVRPELSNLIAKYYCKFCTWKGEGTTLWKRKCCLEHCYNPIAESSKYCSEEHGKEYMQQLLFENSMLDQGVIKKVLTHVGSDVSKLHSLGAQFPELEEVKSFKQDATRIDQFPRAVREQVECLQQKIKEVQEKKQLQMEELGRLQSMKEDVRAINEKLSALIFPEGEDEKQVKAKSKRGKQKKRVDLCLCSKGNNGLIGEFAGSKELLEQIAVKVKKRMNDAEEEEVVDEEENENENEGKELDDLDWFRDICIRDRKKCYRHNGWWNLFYDNAEKLSEQLQARELDIERQIDEVLRNYCVEQYNK